MKLLILTMNVGWNAPGIIFERLIYGLSKCHEIDVVTSVLDPNMSWQDSSVRFYKIEKQKVHPLLQKYLVSFFHLDPFDFLWAYKVKKKIKEINTTGGYDLVLSFVSSSHCGSLIAGEKISKALGCKHAAHLIDAIPAPVGWLQYDAYYKGLKKMITRYLSRVDGLFPSNPKMLEYQVKVADIKSNVVTSVIYSPSLVECVEYPPAEEKSNVFLYTGGIYTVRKPDFVIRGFEKLLSVYPDSRLIFVGTRIFSDTQAVLDSISPGARAKIEFHPFAKDLSGYYSMAAALLDIDAVLENDVFLSSKMSNYITVNRIIISETGHNSPSRMVFKGIDSIIQCYHDSDEIFEAMKKAILMKQTVSFEDRKEVRRLFELSEVVKSLNCAMSRLVSAPMSKAGNTK